MTHFVYFFAAVHYRGVIGSWWEWAWWWAMLKGEVTALREDYWWAFKGSLETNLV